MMLSTGERITGYPSLDGFTAGNGEHGGGWGLELLRGIRSCLTCGRRSTSRQVQPRILVMEMTSLADAKARLSELVATVAGTWERVVITKNGRPVAVLMSVEDLEALVETLEVLSDPEAMSAIRASEQPDAEWTTGEEMAAIMAKRSDKGAA
jgi:prevent-host-death family protein